MIENNIFNNKQLSKIIKRHIDSHELTKLKRFVLACTHFELVEDLFKRFCADSEIVTNSSYMLEKLNFNIDTKELNVIVLQSKQDVRLEEKIFKLLRG